MDIDHRFGRCPFQHLEVMDLDLARFKVNFLPLARHFSDRVLMFDDGQLRPV